MPIIKPKAEWTNEDLAIIELNTKACYTLAYAFSRNEYNKICRLKMAKEIWDSRSINYEGIKDVQLRKVITLTRHYESYHMEEGEFVDDMLGRLQVLLNKLEALGQNFTKAQINLQILNSFPRVWEHKTTIIQEARNFKTLALDKLLGILRVHEVHLQNMDHLPKRNFVVLKTGETSSKREERKSPSRVLKVHMNEFDASDNNFEISIDDEMALM
ncbi:hypothetical protein JHK86_035030 [Glycine max]|nr:hypothetical protein JHK86_035030 [Glycine max]